jgi:hypothetical protein
MLCSAVPTAHRCLDCLHNAMRNSRLDRFLAPWVFVLTGVVFNILAAVITHYFIGLNNDQIAVLERDIQNKQVLIDSLWQSRVEVERKQEFFILLLTSQSESPAIIETYYRKYLDDLVNAHGLKEFNSPEQRTMTNDIELMLAISSAAQESIIESINATYFETLELQEAKMPLEQDNSRLFSIAIFLQVIGLILVLARDLRRH